MTFSHTQVLAGAGRRRDLRQRHRQWRVVLGTVLLACALASVARADVHAEVEPAMIDELETTRLTLHATGTTPQALDLTPLSADFEVLGTQTATQYRSVDGVVEAWVEYQIALRPTHSGRLTIPALKVGDATSAPLTLVVREIDPAVRAAIDRMVFFEVELSRNPVYVRGETVLIRRLFYSDATQIYSDLPGPPEVADVLITPIGETRSDTVIRDGQRYGVIEQRFALYPEHSGSFTIPSISLTSSVRLQIDGQARRTGARVSTRPLTIEVLPVPPEYPTGLPWLPATKVTISDAWAPDRPRIDVGEPVQRRVTVTVYGNLAAAIAPPADGLPDRYFRQYPEPAVLDDDRNGDSVTGTRTTAYAIIPTAPGTIEVPGLAVTWWDVDRGEIRTTRIDSRAMTIAGNPPNPGSSPVGTAPIDTAAAAAAPAAAAPEPSVANPSDNAVAPPKLLERPTIALAIAAAALVAILLLTIVLARARGSQLTVALARRLAQLGLAGDAHGPARAHRLWLLKRALTAAGRQADPGAIHHALLRYLCCWYQTPPAAAEQGFRAAGYGDLLDRLQAARFAPTAAPTPAATELLEAVRALRPAPRLSTDPLPALHPGR